MTNRSNPSDTLTLEAVDDIIDRTLRGHYEKKRPVTPLELMETGLWRDWTAQRRYVEQRWRQSPAGVTMRHNNLNRKIDSKMRGLRDDTPGLVWKIGRRYSSEAICYATGTRQDAVGWAHMVYGWTIPGVSRDDLIPDLVGCGGLPEVIRRNMEILPRVRESISNLEREIARMQDRIAAYNNIIETTLSATAHLAGLQGEAVTNGATAA